jgi:hypothetical protein
LRPLVFAGNRNYPIPDHISLVRIEHWLLDGNCGTAQAPGKRESEAQPMRTPASKN